MKFRLLRMHKSGKIIVASYMQWVRIKNLEGKPDAVVFVDKTCLEYPKDKFCYNHKLRQVFFYENHDPSDMIKWSRGEHWVGFPGLDCDGVPALSNYTIDTIPNLSNIDMDYARKFTTITVGDAINWFTWFLLNLENVRIEYFTPPTQGNKQ